MEMFGSWTMTPHRTMASMLALQFFLRRPTGSDHPLAWSQLSKIIRKYRMVPPFIPDGRILLHLRHRIGVFQPPPAISGLPEFQRHKSPSGLCVRRGVESGRQAIPE